MSVDIACVESKTAFVALIVSVTFWGAGVVEIVLFAIFEFVALFVYGATVVKGVPLCVVAIPFVLLTLEAPGGTVGTVLVTFEMTLTVLLAVLFPDMTSLVTFDIEIGFNSVPLFISLYVTFDKISFSCDVFEVDSVEFIAVLEWYSDSAVFALTVVLFVESIAFVTVLVLFSLSSNFGGAVVMPVWLITRIGVVKKISSLNCIIMKHVFCQHLE